MTSVPDWLVERAALDEVPSASRDRIERADPRELAERVGLVRDDNAAELARYPAGPAVAQIEARIAAEQHRRKDRRRRERLGWLGAATAAAAILVIGRFAVDRAATRDPPSVEAPQADGVRAKGPPRLSVFRRVGDQVERLERDALVRAGDVLQLRYNPGGQGYGVIASIDGAGAVTLHFPTRDEAAPTDTAVAPDTTTLPHAYALDDAPGFERFFFITADGPIDLPSTLAALRALAHRDDSATAALALPAGMRQWSLRLRKPDRTSTHHESP